MKNLLEVMAGLLFGGLFFGYPVIMMWLAEKHLIIFWAIVIPILFSFGKEVVRDVKDYIG